MERYRDTIERRKKKKSRFSRFLVPMLEILVVVLAVLERSRIARFLTTKVVLDLVVEVTDKFGADAGHRLSTIIAGIVAEPMIIAYIAAGFLLAMNLLVLVIRKFTWRPPQPEPHRPPGHDDPERPPRF